MPKQSLIRKIHLNTERLYKAIDMAIRLNNYRQEDLAKVLHIKQNTVSYHLKHHTFDQDQLNDLLDFLGLEIKVCVKES